MPLYWFTLPVIAMGQLCTQSMTSPNMFKSFKLLCECIFQRNKYKVTKNTYRCNLRQMLTSFTTEDNFVLQQFSQAPHELLPDNKLCSTDECKNHIPSCFKFWIRWKTKHKEVMEKVVVNTCPVNPERVQKSFCQ